MQLRIIDRPKLELQNKVIVKRVLFSHKKPNAPFLLLGAGRLQTENRN